MQNATHLPSPDLAVVIPCHDEAKRLDVQAFARHLDAHPQQMLIFVDDGSADDTPSMLEGLGRTHSCQVRILRLPDNRGKAEAVRHGVRVALDAGPAFVGYLDADLATPLRALELLRLDLEAHPDVLLSMGSRVQLLGHRIERRGWRHVLGRVFATMAAATLDLPVYDTQCGAKLFRVTEHTPDVFREPFLTRWFFDVEILARLLGQLGNPELRRRVRELPLPEWTDIGRSKVRPKDFLLAARDLRRIRRAYALDRRPTPG